MHDSTTKGPLLQDDDLPGQHGRFHRCLITTHDTAPPKILLTNTRTHRWAMVNCSCCYFSTHTHWWWWYDDDAKKSSCQQGSSECILHAMWVKPPETSFLASFSLFYFLSSFISCHHHHRDNWHPQKLPKPTHAYTRLLPGNHVRLNHFGFINFFFSL